MTTVGGYNIDSSVMLGIGVAVVCTLVSWVAVVWISWKSFRVKRDTPSRMADDQIEFLMRNVPRTKVPSGPQRPTIELVWAGGGGLRD